MNPEPAQRTVFSAQDITRHELKGIMESKPGNNSHSDTASDHVGEKRDSNNSFRNNMHAKRSDGFKIKLTADLSDRKRIKVDVSEQSGQWHYKPTPVARPTTFLQALRRKKNKEDFLQNYAFGYEELILFEKIHKESLFDSRINGDGQNQVDLSLLDRKPVVFYRAEHFSQAFNSFNPAFHLKCSTARTIIRENFRKVITNSQILDIMSKCESEEVFWHIINHEKCLLANYLDTAKPYIE